MMKVNISNGILSDWDDKISKKKNLGKHRIKWHHSYLATVKIYARVKTIQKKSFSMNLICISIFQFTIAYILVLAVAVNVNGYDYNHHQVVEVAKVHSGVGSHGPALVNVFGPNKNGYSWGASSGSSGSYEGGYGGGSSGLQFTHKLNFFLECFTMNMRKNVPNWFGPFAISFSLFCHLKSVTDLYII